MAEPWGLPNLLKDEDGAISRNAQGSDPVKKNKVITFCLKRLKHIQLYEHRYYLDPEFQSHILIKPFKAPHTQKWRKRGGIYFENLTYIGKVVHILH